MTRRVVVCLLVDHDYLMPVKIGEEELVRAHRASEERAIHGCTCTCTADHRRHLDREGGRSIRDVSVQES